MVFTMEMMVERLPQASCCDCYNSQKKDILRRGRQNDRYVGKLTGDTKNETGVGKNAHSITGDIVNWQIVTGEKVLSLLI